jgi:hypothetical protein
VSAAIEAAQQRGWLEPHEGDARWRPTARGFDFLSDLQALFLPER